MSVYSARREVTLHARCVACFEDCSRLLARLFEIDRRCADPAIDPQEEWSLISDRQIVEAEYSDARARFRNAYDQYYWDYPFLAVLLHDELQIPDTLVPLIGGVPD